MKKINIIPLLSLINGASFVSLDTTTDVKLRGGKKNLMLGRVTKKSTVNVTVMFQNKNSNGYENMVKRRLEKEGKDPESFKLSQRKWGVRVPNLPLVEHKEQYYIECIFLGQLPNVEYYLDGELIKKEDIEGFPPSPIKPDQGGLEDKVVIRTFNLSSIDCIRMNKEEYKGEFIVKM